MCVLPKKLLLFPIFCFVELISAIKALFGNQFLGCRASSCNVLGALRVIYTKYGPLKKNAKIVFVNLILQNLFSQIRVKLPQFSKNFLVI